MILCVSRLCLTAILKPVYTVLVYFRNKIFAWKNRVSLTLNFILFLFLLCVQFLCWVFFIKVVHRDKSHSASFLKLGKIALFNILGEKNNEFFKRFSSNRAGSFYLLFFNTHNYFLKTKKKNPQKFPDQDLNH